MKMKKSRIVEWTCDKCGKTVKGYSIFRPYGMNKSKIYIGLGLFCYENKLDLCSDCAYELAETIKDCLRKK